MFSQYLENKLSQQRHLNLSRKRLVIDKQADCIIKFNHKKYVNFSSNDYLSLQDCQSVCMPKSVVVGSGSSPMICGYSSLHCEVEQAFADWLGVKHVVLFGSGYLANISVIKALCGRDHYVFADKLCHRSILDGAQLSRAKLMRFRHNDVEHLQQLIHKHQPHLFITESIFSMEGDLAPVASMMKLCQKYQSGMMIDDAHGIGVLGCGGRGVIAHANLNMHDYVCVVLPLGKAFNAMGAIVVSNKIIHENILQFSSGYTYSTAISPLICLSILSSLRVIKKESWRRCKLQDNISHFQNALRAYGLFTAASAQSPVQSILIPESYDHSCLQKNLLHKGFFCSVIRSPTVAKKSERIRVSINCGHSKQHIENLVKVIADEFKKSH